MRGIAGYGRYDDDPRHIGCPRAKSDMTPCVARDAHTALSDGNNGAVCVGCGHQPYPLLLELDLLTGSEDAADMKATYPSVLAVACADRLSGRVRELTDELTEFGLDD